jgi:hypothetical protein
VFTMRQTHVVHVRLQNIKVKRSTVCTLVFVAFRSLQEVEGETLYN